MIFSRTLVSFLALSFLFSPIFPIVQPQEVTDSVTCLQPNGGEVIRASDTFEIRWTTTATGGKIWLQFSLDSGDTWTLIAEIDNSVKEPQGIGAYVWLVPPVSSNNCRIRVIWAPPMGPSFLDTSDQDFSIKKSLSPFPDLSEDHWAFEAILRLTEEGVIKGYPDGTLGPERPVSRAEFAKMSVLAFALSPSTSTTTFSDLPNGYWAEEQIQTAVAHGLMQGYPEGNFCPDKEVTKAEVITVLVRYKNWPKALTDLCTLVDCSPERWFSPYISSALLNSLIVLDQPGIVRNEGSSFYFDPDLPATRAQTAYLLQRANSLP